MRRALRTVFLTMHTAAVLLLSIPEPAVSDAEMRKPAVRSWYRNTSRTLRAWGVPGTEEEVSGQLRSAGQAYIHANRAVLWPLRTYARWSGMRQSWRMFGHVSDTSAFLRVEVEEGGTWRDLYVARSGSAAWRRRLLDHERMRSFINPFVHKDARPSWRRFGQWLAHEVPRDVPSATRIRITMVEVGYPAPAELRRTGRLVEHSPYWPKIVDVEAR